MASHLKEFLSVGFGIMNCVYRMKLIPLERGLHLAVFFFILIAKLLKHFKKMLSETMHTTQIMRSLYIPFPFSLCVKQPTQLDFAHEHTLLLQPPPPLGISVTSIATCVY